MLKFNMQNQTITRTDSFNVVADSRNYLTAEFMFSQEWKGNITAIFAYENEKYCQLVTDNICVVPWEVIKPPFFTVSIVCGDRVTANTASVAVEKSGYAEGETPKPPTPDVYNQILNSVKLPYIGDNGNWFTWNSDANAFNDTGVKAKGDKPIKGTDYWTEEDKAEIIQSVLNTLPNGDEVSY